MTLKKSDKIIALIGVIIIIIAAVGIFFYIDTDEVELKPKDGEEPMIFKVNYTESLPLSATPDNTDYTIKPKLIRTKPYQGTVVITQQNLKSVMFFVEYRDNKAGFLFGRILPSIGADTITITVNDKDENLVDQVNIKGRGNQTIISDIGTMISMESIEADNEQEARTILEERYVDYEETYTIKISLKTGLWMKLRELLGKDSFTLQISYTYYEYDLEEPENNDDEMPPTGNEAGSHTWAPMALPGKN